MENFTNKLYEKHVYGLDTMKPYRDAYSKHCDLRENENYIQKGLSAASSFLLLFQQAYPNVKVRAVPFRVKSKSSIEGKIKNLAMERLSKLAILNAEYPEKFLWYIKQANQEAIYKNKQDINIDYNLFFNLLTERIHEAHKKIDIKPALKQLEKLQTNPIKNKDDVHDLIAILLNNQAFSKSTKTFISRMIYAKIKLSPILSQENKEDILYDFTTRYGKLAADYMHDPKRDMLQLDDVLKIMDQSQSTYNLTQNENDNRYKSKFDRLLVESEFLRVKDLIAYTLIIENIPENYYIKDNPEFTKLAQKRDSYNKNSKEYKLLNEELILCLASDFYSRIAKRKIPFLQDNQAKKIIDTHKEKNKPGYKALHEKFEICNNPDFSIESQIKSSLIYDSTNGKRSATLLNLDTIALHASRPGKARELPFILKNTQTQEEIQNYSEGEIKTARSELDFKESKFYTIKLSREITKFTPLENTLKLNDDLIFDNPNLEAILKAFYKRSNEIQKNEAKKKKEKIELNFEK